MHRIIEIISEMNIEELLEVYRKADRANSEAEANLMRLLITAELENRSAS